MIDAFLIPANTVITAKGDSEPLDVSGVANHALLATLTITKYVEQESIEVAFFTSADGATWEAKPLAALPQKFYAGEYPLLVDLSQANGAKFLPLFCTRFAPRRQRGASFPQTSRVPSEPTRSASETPPRAVGTSNTSGAAHNRRQLSRRTAHPSPAGLL